MQGDRGRAMDNKEMEINPKLYELVCKQRFNEASEQRSEILRLLRGSNGNPGLVQDVSYLKRVYKTVVKALIFILGVFTAQVVFWAFTKYF